MDKNGAGGQRKHVGYVVVGVPSPAANVQIRSQGTIIFERKIREGLELGVFFLVWFLESVALPPRYWTR
jgi:hypothetical protein